LTTSARRSRLPASAHVDVGHLDRVVSVAEPISGWDIWLNVAGGVGCACAQCVPSDFGRLPLERPVLPLIRDFRGFAFRRAPFAFAGEAEVDVRHRSGARLGLSAHGVCAGGEGSRAGSGVGDPGTHAHERDRLVWLIGPLVG
jgi:hypothetical protein